MYYIFVLSTLIVNLFSLELKLDPQSKYPYIFHEDWGINHTSHRFTSSDDFFISCVFRGIGSKTYENYLGFTIETTPFIKAYPKTFLQSLRSQYLEGSYKKKEFPRDSYLVEPHEVLYKDNVLVLSFDIYRKNWFSNTHIMTDLVKCENKDGVLHSILLRQSHIENSKQDDKLKEFINDAKFTIFD